MNLSNSRRTLIKRMAAVPAGSLGNPPIQKKWQYTFPQPLASAAPRKTLKVHSREGSLRCNSVLAIVAGIFARSQRHEPLATAQQTNGDV